MSFFGNGDGDRSPASSLLLLPSNLQFRCMKYLVFWLFIKYFCIRWEFKNFRFGQEYFLRDSLFWRFFFVFLVQFLGHGFALIFASNGYNSRVAMGFHKFG